MLLPVQVPGIATHLGKFGDQSLGQNSARLSPHVVALALPLVLAVVSPLSDLGRVLGHRGGGDWHPGHGGGGALGLVITLVHSPALLLDHCAALLHLWRICLSHV